MGISLRQRLAGQSVGGDAGQGDVRMDAEQAEQLRAHVPAGAGDSDADHCAHYRFEYWNFCRAPGWPYFLRSRIRGSRVRRPAFFRGSRNLSSKRASARDNPCRTAPAWPVVPPPPTVTMTPNWPTMLVLSSGSSMMICS